MTNDYEKVAAAEQGRPDRRRVLDRVKVRVTTLGKHGVEIAGRGIDPIHVPIARETQAVDPTGVGDGFRAGFFTALSWGLGLERAAQVGSLLATLVLETVGTQEYEVAPATCSSSGSPSRTATLRPTRSAPTSSRLPPPSRSRPRRCRRCSRSAPSPQKVQDRGVRGRRGSGQWVRRTS